MAKNKPKYEPHTMQEKYVFHADRAFKEHKLKDSKMTKAEKAAYSAGYIAHARQTARAYKYNLALDMGAPKAEARAIANNPHIHFDDMTGQFVNR